MEKKQIALNREFFAFIIMGIFLLGFTWFIFAGEKLDADIQFMPILFGGIGALMLIFPIAMMPYCYSFDSKGVTLLYIFLPNERYLWDYIHSIKVVHHSRQFTAFELKGQAEGKKRFYMNSKIVKSWRTKRLLEKYWDGSITGYFGEDLKKWWQKRRAKEAQQMQQYGTDEIVLMEREAQEKTRRRLKPLVEQAEQLNLNLRIKYLYSIEGYKELRSRPEEGYVYTALAELSRPNETNEDRILMISGELLHVRLGKTAYRGSKDEKGLEDLVANITEILQEVRRQGWDVYCGITE